MSSYIFDPRNSGKWNEYIDDLTAFKNGAGGRWWDELSSFFKKPSIKHWVETNDWENIFEVWRPTSGFIHDLLAFFLWMVGIDFMKYLSDEFVENSTIEPENLRKKIRFTL